MKTRHHTPSLGTAAVRRRRWVWRTYVVLLHVSFLGVVWKPGILDRVRTVLSTTPRPELTEYYHRMVTSHLRMDPCVPEGSVVFIGDSLTQGLCTAAVVDRSVNFGIGSDTTQGVLERIPRYECISGGGQLSLP